MPLALPRTTLDAMNAVFLRSPMGTLDLLIVAVFLSMGTLSPTSKSVSTYTPKTYMKGVPVSIASSVWKLPVSAKRISAGTLQEFCEQIDMIRLAWIHTVLPSSRMTTSPGTSSIELINFCSPSRMTVAFTTSKLRSAVRARSALYLSRIG